jgi:hypothetical protein
LPDFRDRQAPSLISIGIAAAIALVNAGWTISLLGLAIGFEATCADNLVSERQCGAGLGLGILWLIGELLLVIPTGWAIHTLVEWRRVHDIDDPKPLP